MNTNANAILDGHIVIRRILAIVIDSLILSMGMLFVNMNFGSLHVTGGTIPGSYTAVYVVDWIWYMIIPFAYFCILEANFSTTIGKRLMGLKVVDGAGQPITLLAAFLRNLLRFFHEPPSIVSGHPASVETYTSCRSRRPPERFWCCSTCSPGQTTTKSRIACDRPSCGWPVRRSP